MQISLESDVSGFGWGGVIHLPEKDLSVRDYWLIDVVTFDSNAERDSLGNLLPHFTPFAASDSVGVNLFAQLLGHADGIWCNLYGFPPFGLVGAVLRFLHPFGIAFTIVFPVLSPLPVWWTVLRSESADHLHLCAKNDLHMILSPSKKGFMPSLCLFD